MSRKTEIAAWLPRPPNDRGQGRKPLPPDQATKPRSVRLNDARWEKLKRLGMKWLEARIDKARL